VAGLALASEMRYSAKKDEAKAAATVAEKRELRDVLVQIKETLRDTVASVEALDERLRRLEAERPQRRSAANGLVQRWLPRALGGGGAEPWPDTAARA